ncbi:MAG: hypothetical protein KDA84_20160, partial [Planctomycetaceae bacterium]|nr:hypothetical protein [Planctomycetaceae bacterium]
MNNSFLSDLAWRIGWTLVHSVWQLLLIGLLVGLVLALLSRRSANLRYGVACLGLASMYLPLIATFMLIPAPPHVPADRITQSEQRVVEEQPTVAVPLQDELEAPSLHSFPGTAAPEPNPDSTPEPVVQTTTEQVTHAEHSTETDTPPTQSWMLRTATPWLPWVVWVWSAAVAWLSAWNLAG